MDAVTTVAAKLTVECPNCVGRGYYMTSEPEHDCGGDEGLCYKICPKQLLTEQVCGVCEQGRSTIDMLSRNNYSNFEIIRMIKRERDGTLNKIK